MKLRLLITILLSSIILQLQAQNVVFDWVNQYGGAGVGTYTGINSIGQQLATDESGYIYNYGHFGSTSSGLVDFDPGLGVHNLNPASGLLFITKTDAQGKFLWAKNFGPKSSSVLGGGISVDKEGYIYVSGLFTDTADLDPGPGVAEYIAPPGLNNAFIIKLDTNANLIWAGVIESNEPNPTVNSMVIDKQSNIYITGSFNGVVDFDPSSSTATLATPSYSATAFICKWDKNGKYVWAKSFDGVPQSSGSYGLSQGYSIALDDYGNIYSVGNYSQEVDFNPSTGIADTFILRVASINPNHRNVYISKLDSLGDFLWTKHFAGYTLSNLGNYIAVDKNGNVYITGYFGGSVDFDPGPNEVIMSAPTSIAVGRSAYVVKLDTYGSFIWAKQLGTPTSGYAEGWAITLGDPNTCNDYNQDIYVGGTFRRSPIDFNPGSDPVVLIPKGTTEDGYVLRLNSDGKFIWVKHLENILVRDIMVNASGSVFTAGHMRDSADFNPDAGANQIRTLLGTLDGFIHKMICVDTNSASIEVTSGCHGLTLNCETYTTSGTYTQRLTNHFGCDSILTIHLTIELPEAEINVDEYTLGTTQDFATYQWLLNGEPIAGATGSTYTVTENGNYTVVVTDDNGCTDTSNVYVVDNVNINDIQSIGKHIKVYPNPAEDILFINSPIAVQVLLTSVEGRVVSRADQATQLSLKDLAPGIYLLHITDQEGQLMKTKKIIKK